MRCPECNSRIKGNTNFCANCGAPVNMSYEPGGSPERGRKKLIIAIVALIALILILAAVITVVIIDPFNKSGDTAPATESETDSGIQAAKDAFSPPAKLYDADSDKLRFEYDDRARIISCSYIANEKQYDQKYTYDDDAEKVEIVTYYEEAEIDDKTISYSDAVYYDITVEVDGYYVRLDKDSSDDLILGKSGFALGRNIVEYNGTVYYADNTGLWANDGEDRLLYDCSAYCLATDGKVIYFGVFNTEESGYSKDAGTTLSWRQYDMYEYDLETENCEKVMSFVAQGQPVCRIDNKIYYTDYKEDFNGFMVELSPSLYSYDVETGEKEMLVEDKTATLALVGHKLFYRRITGAVGMGIGKLECYDIDADTDTVIGDGDIISFKAIGNSVYYTTYEYKDSQTSNRLYRYDIADDSYTQLLEEEGGNVNFQYFDDEYVIYSSGSSYKNAEMYRYDIKNDETELMSDIWDAECKSPFYRDDHKLICSADGGLLVLDENDTSDIYEVSCPEDRLAAVYHRNAYLAAGNNIYTYEIEIIPLTE